VGANQNALGLPQRQGKPVSAKYSQESLDGNFNNSEAHGLSMHQPHVESSEEQKEKADRLQYATLASNRSTLNSTTAYHSN
jgi:hypothetical protein